MKKIILSIGGMTCSACSSGLEKYLNKQKGINKAHVNLVLATANIEYDETEVDVAKLEKFVARAGFKSLGEFKFNTDVSSAQKEKRRFLWMTMLFLFMIFWVIVSMQGRFVLPTSFIYLSVLIVLCCCFLIYGRDILVSGAKNLIHKMPNMDTLVLLSVLSCFLYSMYGVWQIFNHRLNVSLYFETVVAVIYFVKLGRYVDQLSKNKTKEAIQKLVTVTPAFGVMLKNNKEIQVTLDEVCVGDVMVVKAGEKVAVDGEIIDGQAHFDEAFISGESLPLLKKKGDKVVAGSLNYDGYVLYKAEKIGRDSTISEIVRLVEEAAASKAPITQLADKVSGYFVPAVMSAALLTFLFYLWQGKDFAQALMFGVCVLCAACPCALGLAAPLALVTAEGQCLKQGILVKKSSVLETARHVNLFVFDKTGTLTYGQLKIAKYFNYSDMNDADLLGICRSLESASTHPIATAFKSYMQTNKTAMPAYQNFENMAGLGIRATIGKDVYQLGSSKLLQVLDIENTRKNDEEKLQRDGCSIVYVLKNDEIVALFGVKDMLRPEAEELLLKLKKEGIKTFMLTGDNQTTANKVAETLAIDKVLADVSPKQKIAMVRDYKKQGNVVAMCGDGINDSPALTESDVGISIRGGTDIAADAADVILNSHNLADVFNLISISKKTVQVIKQNLFWAFFYNMLMIPAAMGMLARWGIVLNPMMACLGMVLSSMMILLNTGRLAFLGRNKKAD